VTATVFTPWSRHAWATSIAHSAKIVGSLYVNATLLHWLASAARVGHVDRPLGEDRRIVVRERDALALVGQRGARDVVGRRGLGQPVELLGLGDVPVLAELAAEIAPGGAEREHGAAGIEVVERLLLDGIDAEARGAAVGGEHHLAVLVAAHEAERALTGADEARARAQRAADAPRVSLGVPEARGRAIEMFVRPLHGSYTNR